MKKSRDIEVVRLSSELASMQSRVAFLEERQAGCVSREEYEAVIAERDAAIAEAEARDRLHAEEMASLEERHAAEIARIEETHKAETKEYQEIQALLQTENTDFKTLWRFWQGHHFAASSETMNDLMDKVVGKLPTDAVGMMASVASIVGYLNNAKGNIGDIKLPVPSSKAGKASKETKDAKTHGAATAPKNHKKTKCVDIRAFFPADFSELPPGFKVIMRNGKPDEIVIEILFMDKPKAYSKKFTVARCNVPGHDPMSSKYPPRLFGTDVDPTFAAFVLEMKFGYNIPEGRILEMLEKAGCDIPQPTLNRWIHQIIQGLYEAMMPEMLKEVKVSRFTHNDETRILVRSQEKDEDRPSYKTEYIHGILSPEANLFIMLYDKGSRGHQVQLDVFRDSNIIAFIADRCPLYTALITALDCHPLIRGACWIHFRRYLLHAYMQDKRLEPMVHLIARLFAAEKIISNMKDLTETKRLWERKRMCKPLVDAMFAFMQKVRDAGTEYGVLARRAADYLLDDYDGFHAFLDCALLEIGNNAVERCFRAIAKGRENWLQCGSHEAAKHTAFMYSLVESCRMNGLDFGLYIETVLRRILDGDTDIHGMLPNVITLPEKSQNTSAA